MVVFKAVSRSPNECDLFAMGNLRAEGSISGPFCLTYIIFRCEGDYWMQSKLALIKVLLERGDGRRFHRERCY
jgi:hypothetical protein